MGRGRHNDTLLWMHHIEEIAEERQPITIRGIAYQLFTRGVTDSMTNTNVQKVSRLATTMREEGRLPWSWIADETREKEQAPSWEGPERYMEYMLNMYRKDYWDHQALHVEVWSEKGTVRGVLAPVLEEYGVAFRVQHGFASATSVHEAAMDTAHHKSCYKSIILYVGDYDPSGIYMSMVDLPQRLERYGGQAQILRIALT